jgi:hypothetical protein
MAYFVCLFDVYLMVVNCPKRVAANVRELCEVVENKALNFLFCRVFLRSRKFNTSTVPPFCKTPSYAKLRRVHMSFGRNVVAHPRHQTTPATEARRTNLLRQIPPYLRTSFGPAKPSASRPGFKLRACPICICPPIARTSISFSKTSIVWKQVFPRFCD